MGEEKSARRVERVLRLRHPSCRIGYLRVDKLIVFCTAKYNCPKPRERYQLTTECFEGLRVDDYIVLDGLAFSDEDHGKTYSKREDRFKDFLRAWG